ncbi:tRNA (adenosine(37)-N6)-threonylcarbamoyltransferase complex transferase subunit TsaD [Carnobacterium maltaromaticum]|jgi:N6-L-threonylcarbamoyladenine synthase|nr:tRNA (adenosine(37)-N6)-threonylcarbamoyltransferase complex transferase subunit TsaD [Carnobacterium maltaromaticum]AOA02802.1 tRNA (adenosine(37)-N6)-threonylcarbamoyltransferase complex transferase subunit TsaD [Carnobacterium maltaromaticum]KRN71998.1 O-sialoglycoprotein endopeptidase [Carnobacterium maltaromaticum]MBC9787826.1 tRNA (adenosine(37)-N6)-threonylcarbamoyltransferase complex transferase subunit TsaD [Carnobacterium maltaromaticum]MBC9810516.1 tRNA (adenosine(37)-N6)-threonyl
MPIKRNLILAIETSCDETSAAVVEDGHILLSNIIASQIKSHMRFGGVVPEIASRHHVEQITQCIEEAMVEADVDYSDLTAVAVTEGPGLVGALLIGVNAAKAIAYAHNLPLIPVNHMAGHIYANRLIQPLVFPLLALVVSGGHTELVYMSADGEYQIIGETRDDAAGEAYDKVGRVLGLTYPGGKRIDEMAHLGEDTFHFPRGMIREDNYDFSFSGLKSAFINTVHNAEQKAELLNKNDLAASFQASVVDVLLTKTLRAAKELDIKQLVLAGGVAANRGLREGLVDMMAKELPDVELIIPPLSLCGDNAGMIGAAAYVSYQKGEFADYQLNAQPGLSFEMV